MDPIVFIPLTRGKVAVVDFADFELLRGFRWYASPPRNGIFYARRTIPHPTKPGKQTGIQMHTQITGYPYVDHVNRNGLDNRRRNLRPSNPSHNLKSIQRKNPTNSSKFRGVTWHVVRRKWQAAIGFPRGYLGYFHSEEDAARAYDAAAKRFGYSDEALNFPPPRDPDFKIL